MSTNNSDTPRRPKYPDFRGNRKDLHYAIALDKYCDALEQQLRELQAERERLGELQLELCAALNEVLDVYEDRVRHDALFTPNQKRMVKEHRELLASVRSARTQQEGAK